MKVAVVGTGISGMVAARRLAEDHDVTVFEAGSYLGGHTNTLDVDEDGRSLAIDTGFIVFNEATYPELCSLLRELDVPWKPSDMSFSVRNDASGLEYNGTSFDGLFAQRTNLLRPRFWRMVRDILRFYREAPEVLEREDDLRTLGEFLERGRYSRSFVDDHLVPMGAAVWSARPDGMHGFPLRFLVQFFKNHGFLQVDDRPQWLVVQGGSRSYVGPLMAPLAGRIHLSTPVVSVRRTPRGVALRTKAGDEALFDRVVLASHSDQSLRMLSDATANEREVLGAFGYQRNEAVLHTDASLMPRRRRAWASWNYHVPDPPSELATVTYWMNLLQGLESRRDYFVTLNRSDDIAPEHVLRSITYHHPVFTPEAIDAQRRHDEIDGVNGVHFCGAYWRYGFHEDGVRSALRVIANLRRAAAA
ncbi:MAG: FAD-dependent oxidoreductase [Planctomycetota bacterium]